MTQNTSAKNGSKILALSINGNENGFAVFEGEHLIETGQLAIEGDKYYKTLRSIFFTVLKTIRGKSFDVVAIKQEVEETLPGVSSKNMKIVGLIMGACFLSGKIKVIEVSPDALVKACGLSINEVLTKELIIDKMSRFYNFGTPDFKTAEAIAVGLSANFQLKLSETRNDRR